MCHMSGITYKMSRVRCQVSHVTFFFFFLLVVDLVSGGSCFVGMYTLVKDFFKILNDMDDKITQPLYL